jgi:hypothetical protein
VSSSIPLPARPYLSLRCHSAGPCARGWRRPPARPGTFRRDVVTLLPLSPAGFTPVRISPRFWLYVNVGLRAPCVRTAMCAVP